MGERDSAFLRRAIDLAENGANDATPNPRVGCVIVKNGEVIAEGWHRRAGAPHAESDALAKIDGAAAGCEVFLNLEPCAHHGRTPPCAEALIRAGVKRVVASMLDPDPRARGRGMARLRAAGIDAETVFADEALRLNAGFASRHLRRRPWTKLKIAATLDGKSALASGLSQWITGPAARLDAHRLRARSCAVMTGVGTARIDNPRLNARGVGAKRQPLKILVDRAGESRPEWRLFAADKTLIILGCDTDKIERRFRRRPPSGEFEFLHLPQTDDGKVALPNLMRELAARGVNEIVVEAGRRLCGALLAADLVDEIIVYQAPLIFGADARDLFAVAPPPQVAAARRFALADARRVEGSDDVKLSYFCAESFAALRAQTLALYGG